MKTLIKQILIEEFTSTIDNLEIDIIENFQKKKHNFLLSELDTQMIAHMVFVSSFESKTGNTVQICARKIAELRYGSNNVPKILNLNNLDISRISNRLSNIIGQIIITDTAFDSPEVQKQIQHFLTTHEANSRNGQRLPCSLDQRSLNELNSLFSIKGNIQFKPVDLIFFDGENWNLIEIKAGGNLDSSNAPSNAKKLLTEYVALATPNSKVFFATYYHKDGEGNNWTGGMKKFLSYPSLFLIGSNFWNKILPNDISFNDFKEIYREAMNEVNLNQRLNNIVSRCN
jgi:hypothetical protein